MLLEALGCKVITVNLNSSGSETAQMEADSHQPGEGPSGRRSVIGSAWLIAAPQRGILTGSRLSRNRAQLVIQWNLTPIYGVGSEFVRVTRN
jgi:hypothetical protein